MMWRTKRIYHEIAYFENEPEARFDGGFPQSRFLEWMGKSWPMRIVWGAAFFVFYYFFATASWQWLLLPGHWIMGAIHGAIVNWCGHRYGYRNFDPDDDSRNTPARRLPHRGRAVPEQPPQVPDEPELRGALVRDRHDLPGDEGVQLAGHHRHERRQKMRYAPVPAVSPPAAG